MLDMPTFRFSGPHRPKSGNLLPRHFLPSHHHHHSSPTPPSQLGTSPGPKVSMPPPPSFALADKNPVARERHITKDAWQRQQQASTVTTRTTATTKGAMAMMTLTIKPGPATTMTVPTTHHRHVIHVDDCKGNTQSTRRATPASWAYPPAISPWHPPTPIYSPTISPHTSPLPSFAHSSQPTHHPDTDQRQLVNRSHRSVCTPSPPDP